MRLKVEIDELDADQWDQAQRLLQAQYDIPENASRVCLTLVHKEEERHVETPVSALTGLLLTLTLVPAFRSATESMRKLVDSMPDGKELRFSNPGSGA